jgi:hypothetical protein
MYDSRSDAQTTLNWFSSYRGSVSIFQCFVSIFRLCMIDIEVAILFVLLLFLWSTFLSRLLILN